MQEKMVVVRVRLRLLLLLLATLACSSHAYEYIWAYQKGGIGSDVLRDAAWIDDNCFVTVGFVSSDVFLGGGFVGLSGVTDGVGLRACSTGDIQWAVVSGDDQTDRLFAVTANGPVIYATGHTHSDWMGSPGHTNVGFADMWLKSFNGNSGTTSDLAFKGTAQRDLCNLIALIDSNVYLVCDTDGLLASGSDTGGRDIAVLVYDSQGTAVADAQIGTDGLENSHSGTAPLAVFGRYIIWLGIWDDSPDLTLTSFNIDSMSVGAHTLLPARASATASRQAHDVIVDEATNRLFVAMEEHDNSQDAQSVVVMCFSFDVGSGAATHIWTWRQDGKDHDAPHLALHSEQNRLVISWDTDEALEPGYDITAPGPNDFAITVLDVVPGEAPVANPPGVFMLGTDRSEFGTRMLMDAAGEYIYLIGATAGTWPGAPDNPGPINDTMRAGGPFYSNPDDMLIVKVAVPQRNTGLPWWAILLIVLACLAVFVGAAVVMLRNSDIASRMSWAPRGLRAGKADTPNKGSAGRLAGKRVAAGTGRTAPRGATGSDGKSSIGKAQTSTIDLEMAGWTPVGQLYSEAPRKQSRRKNSGPLQGQRKPSKRSGAGSNAGASSTRATAAKKAKAAQMMQEKRNLLAGRKGSDAHAGAGAAGSGGADAIEAGAARDTIEQRVTTMDVLATLSSPEDGAGAAANDVAAQIRDNDNDKSAAEAPASPADQRRRPSAKTGRGRGGKGTSAGRRGTDKGSGGRRPSAGRRKKSAAAGGTSGSTGRRKRSDAVEAPDDTAAAPELEDAKDAYNRKTMMSVLELSGPGA